MADCVTMTFSIQKNLLQLFVMCDNVQIHVNNTMISSHFAFNYKEKLSKMPSKINSCIYDIYY